MTLIKKLIYFYLLRKSKMENDGELVNLFFNKPLFTYYNNTF